MRNFGQRIDAKELSFKLALAREWDSKGLHLVAESTRRELGAFNPRLQRARVAERKLASIDYRRFRPARYTLSDLGTFAKIPDELIQGYVVGYKLAARGAL